MLDSVHPVLMSSNVSASTRFYERLGFSLAFQDDPADPKYAAVTRDGVELHLQWHDRFQWAYPNDRPTGRFLVRDVDALCSELRETGAFPPEALVDSPWLAPWGTRGRLTHHCGGLAAVVVLGIVRRRTRGRRRHDTRPSRGLHYLA